MSENFFDDIGFDLVEKISPPSLPVTDIIELSAPAPDRLTSASSTAGGNKLLSTSLKIIGVVGAVYLGYKIWEWWKEKRDQ